MNSSSTPTNKVCVIINSGYSRMPRKGWVNSLGAVTSAIKKTRWKILTLDIVNIVNNVKTNNKIALFSHPSHATDLQKYIT